MVVTKSGVISVCRICFFQAEDGIRYLVRSRGLGDVYKRQVLTSDLLAENGFGISRYTSTAREAKKQGLWKKENLPVTLDEAVEGFGK